MQKYHFLLLVCLLYSLKILGQASFSIDSLTKHVYILANDTLEGRSSGAKGCATAANYIVNEFRKAGIKPFVENYYHHFVFRQKAVTIESKNIIGFIEGNDSILKEEFILIGAHYDHIGYYFENNGNRNKIIFNGADDNASGVSTIIELGRSLAKDKTLKRSILIVAWDAEESGLFGSYNFLMDSVVHHSKIKLVFSIDMVGMLSKAEGIELYGLGTLEDGIPEAEQLANKHTINLKKSTNTVPKRTDTRAFGEAGIPSIHVTTGTVSPYHKPEDDAELLDYEGMASIALFLNDFVVAQANKTNALISTLDIEPVKPKKVRIGARFNLGSNYHDYENVFYKGKPSFAFSMGFYSQFRLNKLLTIQPEITYENKSAQHALGNYSSQAMTYDLNILFTTNNPTEEDVRAYFLFGGYFSKVFKGNIETTLMEYNDLFNNEEMGINWGLGMDVFFMQVGFTQKIGATYLNKTSNMTDLVNISSYFTLGFTF